MTRYHMRLIETVALTVIAAALLAVAAYMVHTDRMGEAFGTLIGVIPFIVNGIRGLGQNSAMQAMADHLARSQPMAGEGDGP